MVTKSKTLFLSLLLVWLTNLNAQDVQYLFSVSEGLKSPVRIAVDSEDNIYVTDPFQNKICKYDSSGILIDQLEIPNNPLAIMVDQNNFLYIGYQKTGELEKLDPSGTLLKKISTNLDTFALPSAMVMDQNNFFYVVDSKLLQLKKYDLNGTLIKTFGQDIVTYPTGIAYDSRHQRILVAEHGGVSSTDSNKPKMMLHIFDSDGNWVQSVGELGVQPGEFTRIQGITTDQAGQIYLADPFQGIVTVLDKNGGLITTIGEFGTGPGEFKMPMDLVIDSKNRLWITSMNTGKLEVFDLGSITTDIAAEKNVTIPTSSELLQNYPNPFNPGTWIPFTLGKSGQVMISIYNDMGQLIRFFNLGILAKGSYTSEGNAVFWDGKNDKGEPVSSGLYIYKIKMDTFIAFRKMIILK